MVKIIAAIGKNRELGAKNSLLWHIPEDMKFFRETTRGSAVIMGRLTFESIGRPLPNRRNIVLTRKKTTPDGVETASSLEDAISLCGGDCFVIGGVSVYAEALKYAGELILTEIYSSYPEADVYFPAFDPALYRREVLSSGSHEGINFSFVKYSRLCPPEKPLK